MKRLVFILIALIFLCGTAYARGSRMSPVPSHFKKEGNVLSPKGGESVSIGPTTSPFVALSSVTGLAVSAVSPVAIAGCYILDAKTGDSVFQVTTNKVVVTGVSIIGAQDGTVGVSIWVAPSLTATPDTTNSNNKLFDAEGSGTSLYSASNSGNTVVPAGTVIRIDIMQLATSGACGWGVFVMGRRQE